MAQDTNSIVIDNGGLSLKVGFAGYHRPSHLISTDLTIENGIITNWNKIADKWNAALCSEMKVEPSNHCVILSDSVYSSMKDRQKISEVYFEQIGVAGTFIENSNVLSLFGNGFTTGIVVNCGFSQCYITPIIDGNIINDGVICSTYGGRDLTQYLCQLINKNGKHKFGLNEMNIVEKIKRKVCKMSSVTLTESILSNIDKTEFILPDGKKIQLTNEIYQCSEAILYPNLMNIKSYGLQDLIDESINRCNIDTRYLFYEKIVLSGGSSCFSGIGKRMAYEMSDLARPIEVTIKSGCDRKYTSWIGGSIESQFLTHNKGWILKQEYEEHGSNIMLRDNIKNYRLNNIGSIKKNDINSKYNNGKNNKKKLKRNITSVRWYNNNNNNCSKNNGQTAQVSDDIKK